MCVGGGCGGGGSEVTHSSSVVRRLYFECVTSISRPNVLKAVTGSINNLLVRGQRVCAGRRHFHLDFCPFPSTSKASVAEHFCFTMVFLMK